MEKYKGREDVMLEKMKKKYGPTVDLPLLDATEVVEELPTPAMDHSEETHFQAEDGSNSFSLNASKLLTETREVDPLPVEEMTGPNPLRSQLISFYKKHNPSRIDTVDKQLKLYSGRESEMLEKMYEKYGVRVVEFSSLDRSPSPGTLEELPPDQNEELFAIGTSSTGYVDIVEAMEIFNELDRNRRAWLPIDDFETMVALLGLEFTELELASHRQFIDGERTGRFSRDRFSSWYLKLLKGVPADEMNEKAVVADGKDHDLVDAERAFDSLDTSGTRSLPASTFDELITMVGQSLSERELDLTKSLLDPTKTGEMSREAFLGWFLTRLKVTEPDPLIGQEVGHEHEEEREQQQQQQRSPTKKTSAELDSMVEYLNQMSVDGALEVSYLSDFLEGALHSSFLAAILGEDDADFSERDINIVLGALSDDQGMVKTEEFVQWYIGWLSSRTGDGLVGLSFVDDDEDDPELLRAEERKPPPIPDGKEKAFAKGGIEPRSSRVASEHGRHQPKQQESKSPSYSIEMWYASDKSSPSRVGRLSPKALLEHEMASSEGVSGYALSPLTVPNDEEDHAKER
uniref:EF-hand domain-containing protein n=1 Tax=Grammatophora oceanica TaxID=210454 RepID=A0A7S1Y281_9STRA